MRAIPVPPQEETIATNSAPLSERIKLLSRSASFRLRRSCSFRRLIPLSTLSRISRRLIPLSTLSRISSISCDNSYSNHSLENKGQGNANCTPALHSGVQRVCVFIPTIHPLVEFVSGCTSFY